MYTNPIKKLYVPFTTFIEQILAIEDDNICEYVKELFLSLPDVLRNRYMMQYPFHKSYLTVCAELDHTIEYFPSRPLFNVSENRPNTQPNMMFSLTVGEGDERKAFYVSSTFEDRPILIREMPKFTFGNYLVYRYLPFFNSSLTKDAYDTFAENVEKNNASILLNDMRNNGFIINRKEGFTLTAQPTINTTNMYKIFIYTDEGRRYYPICDVVGYNQVGSKMADINERIVASFEQDDKIIYSNDWVEY